MSPEISKKAVLTIEEKPGIKDILRLCMLEMGFEEGQLLFTEDLTTTQKILKGQDNPPGIIFLSIGRDVQKGASFLQTLKAEDDFRDIPIVVISTESRVDIIEGFKELGASSYIEEPFDLKTIEDEVRKHLNLE